MGKIPIILHIPHWATYIPPDCRQEIHLNDASLQEELLRMTDLHTELAAEGNWADAVVMAEVSRLVVDVERFRDDSKEEMATKGMGAVYTKTHDGRILRKLSPERKEELLQRYYDPHHQRLTQAVENALKRSGRCVLLDIHSFPERPLAYEKDQRSDRPDICIGTDAYHTSREIAGAAIEFYRSRGLVVWENEPFAGSLVPMKYYRKDCAVYSLMIEFNRKSLSKETGILSSAGKKLLSSIRILAETI